METFGKRSHHDNVIENKIIVIGQSVTHRSSSGTSILILYYYLYDNIIIMCIYILLFGHN